MSTEVTLPALGESVTEGTISRWLKAVGDTVEADEPFARGLNRQGRHRDSQPGSGHPRLRSVVQ